MSNTPSEKGSFRRVRRVLLIVLAVFLSLGLGLVCTVGVLYWHGRSSLLGQRDEVSVQLPESFVDSVDEEEDTIEYQGKTYRFNEQVVSVLLMGIDKEDIQQSETVGLNGQADTLLLATIDTVTGAVSILPISRETMAEVDQYAADGSLIGTEIMQICLAYAYADGGADSCQNVCRSVSRLLYGIPIDSYIAIDLEGVEVATDMIGGVTLETLEDIAYRKGNVYLSGGETVTLTGHQAMGYLRYRNKDVEANNRRMQRQKQFFTAFVNQAAKKLKQDFTKLDDYYTTLQPYALSDLDLSKITYLVSTCLLNRDQLTLDFRSIKGKSVAGEEYTEFYPDEQSVYEAVLATFYQEVTETA